MIVFIFAFMYCCMAVFLGCTLERMSKESKYRTTERVSMGYWSGFFSSSAIFVPAIFLISSIVN